MLISVVVPTFRRLHLLPHALDSLAAQTHGEFEVLVCDNDADPAVGELVAGYGPRFRWCPRPTNLGSFGNITSGFAEARGDFLSLLCDDDVFEPDCLAALLEPVARDSSLALSFADYRMMDLEGELLPPREAGPSFCRGLAAGLQREPARLVVSRAVGLCPCLLRRGTVDWEQLPAEVGPAVDVYAPLEAVRSGGFWFVDAQLAKVRVHPGRQTTTQLLDQQQRTLTALTLSRDRLPSQHVAALDAGIRTKSLAVYRLTLQAGREADARRLAQRVVREQGGTFAWLLLFDHLPLPVRLHLLKASEHGRRFYRDHLQAAVTTLRRAVDSARGPGTTRAGAAAAPPGTAPAGPDR